MAEPSTRIIQALRRFHRYQFSTKPTSPNNIFSHLISQTHQLPTTNPLRNYYSMVLPNGFSNSRHFSSQTPSKMSSLQSGTKVFSSKRLGLNNKIIWIKLGSRFFPPKFNGSTVQSAVDKPLSAIRSRLNNMINWNPLGSRFFPPKFNGSTVKYAVYKPLSTIRSGLNNMINWNPLGSRFFPRKFNGSTVKSAVYKPLSAIRSTFLQYREAAGLQIEAFWKRTNLVVVGFIRAGVRLVWWRVMFGIASTFVGLATAIATYTHLMRPTEEPPTRLAIFLLTDSHKDGRSVNEVAAEKIREMKYRISKGGLEDTTSRDDVYFEVIGSEKSGRVRGVGFGPAPTSLWGSSSSHCVPPSSVIMPMNDKIHHLEELLKQRDVEMTEQQRLDTEIAAQLKRAEAEMT